VNEWIQSLKNLRTLGWIRPFEKSIFTKRILETENRVAMVTNGQIMNSFSSNITYWLNLIVIIYFLYSSTTLLDKTDILVLIWVVGVFLSRPLRQLPWLLTMFFDALTSVRRLNQILSLRNQSPDYASPPEKNEIINQSDTVLKIENMNLDLNYNQKNHRLLNAVNLEIKAGEVIALIGPVGSGKSLLLKSIIKDAPFTADYFFSKPAAYLPQDPFIFNSKIHNNLSFSYDDEFDLTNSMQALHLAHFETAQFTETLHTHDQNARENTMLQTLIGERGVNISGGQKQRLNLARLFYKPKALFLLDDPFSAVDINTEYAITKSILELKKNKHAFLITTQRHTFLKHADRILYLDHGKIVFDGSYEDFKASVHHE
jgi:ABC-type multidrug transport system fused ATPase/permease subunit